MRKLLSGEFLNMVSSNKKFDGIELSYADLSGREFTGLSFRKCRFLFCLMRHCSFKDVDFTDCEIFFGSFGSSRFENCTFSRCKIEYTGFTDSSFSNSTMKNSQLSWISMIGAALPEMLYTQEFKVFRGIASLSQGDI